MDARRRRASSGFTLIEIMIALALVTGLTLMMFQAITPWLKLRQKIETEHRLSQLREAIGIAYRANAMGIESQAGAQLQLTTGSVAQLLTPSAFLGTAPKQSCAPNPGAAAAIATFVAEDPTRSLTDGNAQPLCVFVSPQLGQNRDGITLYYHVVALVAVGNDGHLSAGTGFDPNTGELTVDPASDDMGVVVNGFGIQLDLYLDTHQRLDRVADLYTSYFTARYLANPARDYSVDYFLGGAAPYDSDATANRPLGTGSAWQPVGAYLAPLGLGLQEQTTAYESANEIEVANQMLDLSQLVGSVQVQEPAVKGVALPPYTALLRAALPGPVGTYLVRVVPGNY
jgi:prepilin-type N-terminal cleavage/methylation domain-containing protein